MYVANFIVFCFRELAIFSLSAKASDVGHIRSLVEYFLNVKISELKEIALGILTI